MNFHKTKSLFCNRNIVSEPSSTFTYKEVCVCVCVRVSARETVTEYVCVIFFSFIIFLRLMTT